MDASDYTFPRRGTTRAASVKAEELQSALLPLNNRTHYHLVVEARREQMSHAVHRLNGLFAQSFNRRHERRGHPFENRFSSWVIGDEGHLDATIAYVLENPVNAGLCTDAREWLWSWSEVVVPADLASLAAAV